MTERMKKRKDKEAGGKGQNRCNQHKGGGWRFLRPGHLKGEIRRFGYQFSPRAYAACFIGLYACIAGFSYIFRLNTVCVLVICVVSGCFVPGMFIMIYRNLYEQKRFEDITAYMEQILYSFKRRAKILTSLEDTLALFEEGESRIYGAISSAIKYIQSADAGEHLYREAFASIENEYGCSRLYKIHDFLIEAEEVGGNYDTSADILLNDRRLWIDRIYGLQREKKNVKVKITIGIGLSFLICGMTVLMLPKEFGITDNLISQAVTTMVILLNLLIWYAAQKKLSKSLLREEEELEYEEIKRQYEYVMHRDMGKEKRKGYFFASLLLPVVVFLGLKGNMLEAALTAVLAALLATQPMRRYRVSLRHVTKAVEKAFPQWLMNMSLQLQTDNVHVSLAKSVGNAPQILKEELGSLLGKIEAEPDSIQPYLGFMRKVRIPDITSSMKVLYSMAEFGAADIGGQIGPLVERNAVMTDKSERLRAEDEIAGISLLVLLPMITGVLKMLADLALVVVYILSAVSNVS